MGFVNERWDLRIAGVDVGVSTSRRAGELDPVVFLHGFGSTKEDYVDIVRHPAFGGRPFLAYDASPSRVWSGMIRWISTGAAVAVACPVTRSTRVFGHQLAVGASVPGGDGGVGGCAQGGVDGDALGDGE